MNLRNGVIDFMRLAVRRFPRNGDLHFGSELAQFHQ
jgi:hypothetical protein